MTDCRVVLKPKVVKETKFGYKVPSGELLSYTDQRLRVSKDGDFHWCTGSGADDTPTICLYVPPRGF